MIANQVDLHMHSLASDGTDSPVQLLAKVRAEGVRTFSLTDHDTVAGVEQLSGVIPEDVFFIPGIEFSCRMASGACHILGYNCDFTHPSFQAALVQGGTLRKAKMDRRLEFLQEQRNIRFPQEELERLYQMPSAGKPHLANLMVKYGYAKNKESAIKDTINLCVTGNSRIQAETAVRAILNAGGIPVWAHPMGEEGKKPVTQEQFKEMLKALIDFGVMGMECYYSKYPRTCCMELAETAKRHRLLISAGSDYHGTNKAISLGTLNAENSIVPEERITILDALMERGRKPL